jgi:DNA-directed RNA polymerase subunit RPC12/RpoP
MSNLPEAPKAYLCTECGARVETADVLTAPNPFDPDDTISACPECRSIEQFARACTVPDCKNTVGCGVPGALGYRYAWLCGKHYREQEGGE